MIEFKAECGHTVRARDEDAGAVVRCSYCGKNAKVPEDAERDLDALFRELQHDAPVAAVHAPAPRRRRTFFSRAARGGHGEFNPFPIILRLVYATVLLAIVVVLYQKAIKPMLSDTARDTRAVRRGGQTAETPKPPEETTRRKASGFIGSIGSGLFVRSTPSGGAVFCIESSRATTRGRINRIKGCSQINAEEGTHNLSDGTYVVEVAFVYNDPRFKTYRGYNEFRRAIDDTKSDSQRASILDAFFIPDGASDVFVAEQDYQTYIVRQYRDVEIRQGQPYAVRALFLPRIPKPNEPGFSIEEIVANYLSAESRAYGFDEAHVASELAYYGVPEGDRRWVMEALARIGVISYVTPDRRTRLFWIGVHDGTFAQRVIREARE